MELHLVVPVPEGEAVWKGDEKLNGKWWRVKGPIASDEMDRTKFHCVSYVWGTGIVKAGGFFDCQRDISDKTRPALEAAMKAVDTIYKKEGRECVQAFWIDAICVPQIEGEKRHGTLERHARLSLSEWH
jgi:Heterokaryon incompatibility protein (HET)